VVNPHRSALVCGWHHSPGPRCPQNDRVPIIPVTILASASINASDAIVVELVEADEPRRSAFRGPAKRTIFHPRRFPSGADAAAAYWPPPVKLAQIRRERRL